MQILVDVQGIFMLSKDMHEFLYALCFKINSKCNEYRLLLVATALVFL